MTGMEGSSPTTSIRRGNDENSDILKEGPVVAGFAPIKQKRSYYGVLCERVLELYEKEKDYRKKKPARYVIELSNTFNVHDDHLEPKIKQCMCWMGPQETLCLRGETTAITTEWYNAIYQAVKMSRTLTLCRPVTADEFFCYVWDVEVMPAPKFKKPLMEAEKLPSITETPHMPPGPKRLCFYPHTILFCNRGIEPTMKNCITSNVPPFDRKEYEEVQRQFCAFFGAHERYFIIKLGRASPAGSCTIWVQCESEEIALHIYRKLNMLIDKEAEKKKNMNITDINSALTSLRDYQRTANHRDRSHTQPIQMKGPHRELDEAEEDAVAATATSQAPALKSIIQYAPRDRRNMLMERKATVASFEEDGTRLQTPQLAHLAHLRPRGSLGNPTAIELLGRKLCSPTTSGGLSGRKSSGASLSARAASMGSPAKSNLNELRNNANPVWSVFPAQQRRSSNTSASQSIVEEPGDYQMMSAPAKKVEELPAPRNDDDNNEDSGGTLRLENDLVTCEKRPPVNLVDRRVPDSDTDERSSVGGISGHSMQSAGTEENYAPMENNWEQQAGGNFKVNVTQFDRLDDNKYVSDSSDSCYSSMAANSSMTTSMTANTPRAYSFGGRPQLKHVVTTINENGLDAPELVATLVPPLEDPRKRSYSLGSKNFITRPFTTITRKFASNQGRQQRHSQTSASGASLASSAGSSFGPSSSSNHLASVENEEQRNRSGSFGSGRSTPYTKRIPDDAEDHLVEMEFPTRSCSSSMASIESPSSRSRTSSFGYSTRKDDFFTGPQLMKLEELQLDRLKEIHRDMIQVSKDAMKNNECDPVTLNELLAQKLPFMMQELHGPPQKAFAAIEESDSESSRKGSRQSLNVIAEEPAASSKNATPVKPHDYDEDYAPMDVSQRPFSFTGKKTDYYSGPMSIPSTSAAKQSVDDDYCAMEMNSTTPKPTDADYAPMELPAKALAAGLAAAKPTSSSTPSPAIKRHHSNRSSVTGSPSSSRTTQENSSTRPDRSASSPVREVLAPPPAGIPKRCSVPSMRSDSKDDSSLNYASLQIYDDPLKPGSLPKDSFLASPAVNRTRSQSGIIYTDGPPSDYASVKPIL